MAHLLINFLIVFFLSLITLLRKERHGEVVVFYTLGIIFFDWLTMGQLALFNYFLVIVATVAITVEGVPGGRSSSKTRFIKPNLREPPMWVNDTHIIDILLRNSSYLDVTGLPLPDLSWCPKCRKDLR